MPISKDYLYFPDSATVGEVLRAYVNRQCQWWWLLITETDGEYHICSFGSLLPYLTGRTSHIVHNIGDCVICSGMDPLLWSDTGALVEEALADVAICSQFMWDLPMAELPIIEANNQEWSQTGSWLMRQGLRVCGVTENGILSGVYILQVMGDLGGLPDF